MYFLTDIFHPNSTCALFRIHKTTFASLLVDEGGHVCISTLHEPGDDRYGYEKAEERWLPIHTVETILLSVISMLADPNSDSPANVDAAVRRVFSFFLRLFFA